MCYHSNHYSTSQEGPTAHLSSGDPQVCEPIREDQGPRHEVRQFLLAKRTLNSEWIFNLFSPKNHLKTFKNII